MKTFINIVLLILGAALGVVGSISFYWYQNRVQYLDFTVHKTESLLSKPNNIDSLSILINGKKINDISELEIDVFNYTDKEFKGITVVVEFNQPNDFETITQTVLDENKAKDLVETVGLPVSKFVRFGYKAIQLSRNDNSPVLSIKYLIKGKSIPSFRLYSLEGTKFRERSEGDKYSVAAVLKSSELLIGVASAILIIILSQLMISLTNTRLFRKELEIATNKLEIPTFRIRHTTSKQNSFSIDLINIKGIAFNLSLQNLSENLVIDPINPAMIRRGGAVSISTKVINSKNISEVSGKILLSFENREGTRFSQGINLENGSAVIDNPTENPF